MGKKHWLTPLKPPVVIECSIVKSVACQLNKGLGCTCGKHGHVISCTEADRRLAASLDVSKTLKDAIEARKAAGLPVVVS